MLFGLIIIFICVLYVYIIYQNVKNIAQASFKLIYIPILVKNLLYLAISLFYVYLIFFSNDLFLWNLFYILIFILYMIVVIYFNIYSPKFLHNGLQMINYLLFLIFLILAFQSSYFNPIEVNIFGYIYYSGVFSERYYFLFYLIVGIYLTTHVVIRAQYVFEREQSDSEMWLFYKKMLYFMFFFLLFEIGLFFVLSNIDLFLSVQPLINMYLLHFINNISDFSENNYFLNNIISIEVFHNNSQRLIFIPLQQILTDSMNEREDETKLISAILLAAISITKELDRQNEIIKFNYGNFYKHAFVNDRLGIIIVINTKLIYLAFEKGLMGTISSQIEKKYSSLFEQYKDLENKIPEILGLDAIIMRSIGIKFSLKDDSPIKGGN